MVLFISHGENNKPILFGVILVSLAFFSLKIENKKQTNRNFRTPDLGIRLNLANQ